MAAQIEAAFRAMGHPLSADSVERARRILAGELTPDEAVAEIFAELDEEVRADETGDTSGA